MTIIPIVTSIISLVIASIVAFTGLYRNHTKDDKENISEMTTVIVKLENIGSGVSEIKSDLRSIKDEIRDVRERLVIVEQSCKSAHKRLDTLEESLKGDK